ncbi:MAG: hypothetical protein A3J38_05500 [Gammaproteobacteria bacterium RIFCSPHIGHO2_12_FULL_45_9]|nr:MAG: hypothetical protein A3J38_05500 [Gammaproteobacteria bacterium RIFCSPHIGHO2_12_FULL_45_9]
MIRRKGFHFVDKTGFIQELLARSGELVTLLTRPRRFGKTLNLSMLQHFFAESVHGEPTRPLFNGLKITQDNACMAHQGKYPVIFISLKAVKTGSFEEARGSLAVLLQELYENYQYLTETTSFTSSSKETFDRILNLQATDAELHFSLLRLCRWLRDYHGVNPWVLIDEYDTPIQTAYLKGYYEPMIAFMQAFLGNTLKTNPYLERAVLTGILRVARESLFSDMNNVGVYTLFNDEYSEHFGFTEPEVNALLEQTGFISQGTAIKTWYNGYLCGDTTLYNPWSIICCLSRKGALQPYWVQTGGTAMIQDLLAHADASVKTCFEDLLSGKTISARISEHLAYGLFGEDIDAVMSLLLAAGYLKAISRTQDIAEWVCELAIPNQEVLAVYRTCVVKWFAAQGQENRYRGLLRALTEGDVRTFTREMKQFFEYTVSYFDTSHQQPEKFYHGLVLGMIISLTKTHTIESNRESGVGRYDVILIPHDLNQPGVVLEFKVTFDDETMEAAALEALQQIKDKRYAATLYQRRVTRVLALALAFSGKQVTILSEWLSEEPM